MHSSRKRDRELGIAPRILPVGKWNAITDVSGVKVGHITLIEGDDIRTGVTAVLPHGGNLFAPLSDRNLKRLAKRGLAGLARTGASMSNGSGDYVIAFSTAEEVRRTEERRSKVWAYPEVPNDSMAPLFQAAIEVTEEAIYNSLWMAETMAGYRARKVDALPLDRIEAISRRTR